MTARHTEARSRRIQHSPVESTYSRQRNYSSLQDASILGSLWNRSPDSLMRLTKSSWMRICSSTQRHSSAPYWPIGRRVSACVRACVRACIGSTHCSGLLTACLRDAWMDGQSERREDWMTAAARSLRSLGQQLCRRRLGRERRHSRRTGSTS